MARAFLLYLFGGISLRQWREDGVLEVVGPFPRLRANSGGELGPSLSFLSVLILGYSQPRDFAPASGASEAL